MKKIIEEHFLKSLPEGKKESILEKLDKFLQEFKESNFDFRKISKGYSMWKVKGRKLKGDIFKLRISIHDRVLFTFGSEVENIRADYKDSIIFIDYCCHDNQIVKGRKVNFVSNYLNFTQMEREEYWDNLIDEEYENFHYNPDKLISRVLNSADLKELLASNSKKAVYYLSDEQYNCLNRELVPLFLFGSAGSGKTTIGVYKLFLLCESNIKISYFTYSRYLKNEVLRLFADICEEEQKGLYDVYKNKIQFTCLNDYLLEKSGEFNYVCFEEFDYWLKNKLFRNQYYSNVKFESIDIWKEIRGVIKGVIGVNWITEEKFDLTSLNKNTVEFLKDNELIAVSEDQFNVTASPSKILEKLHNYKGEFKEIINVDIESILNNLNKDIYEKRIMDREAYLNLPEEYSIFDYNYRNLIYDIAVHYGKWLENEKKVDENDISRIVLEKIYNESIEKFDFIMIDEVQDLTEIQIYVLYNIVKNKNNVFFSGDYNQTINPTFFSTTRIESLFKRHNSFKNFNKKMLTQNYRSSENIIKVANELSKLRIEKLSSHKNGDYLEESIREETEKPFFLQPDDKNKKQLIETVLKKHYAAIVVPDKNEKDKLEKYIDRKNVVFTVNEIKGIEKRYIICYNIISKYKEMWDEIFNVSYSNQFKQRYYFNLLYVAITRARDYLCFYEENMNNSLLEYLRDNIELVWEFDENKLMLDDVSSEDEFYNEGLMYEENGLYAQAVELYKNASSKAAQIAIKRCEALMKNKEGFHIESGNTLMDIKEYEKAAECYRQGEDSLNYLKALVFNNENYKAIEEKLTLFNEDPLKIIYRNKNKIQWLDKFKFVYINSKLNNYDNNFNRLNNATADLNSYMDEFNRNYNERIIRIKDKNYSKAGDIHGK